MSLDQWRRWDIIKRIQAGTLTTPQGAKALGLSKRHVRRIRRAVEKKGRASLIHGNKGREPPNRLPRKARQQIVALFKCKYVGFNDQHFTEKLNEVEGLSVSRPTVRRLLRGERMVAVRKRRPCRHRARRERKAQAGQMIIWDGSPHDWLEERGPSMCLMGAIEDASGDLLEGAHFVERECSAGYLRILREIAGTEGLPLMVYQDMHSALKRNDNCWTLEEELRGEQDPTQVGRALKALGIEVIFALSPQAKGRVERLWGTLQDRLTSEMRLARCRTIKQANEVLSRYRPEFNKRFSVPAREVIPAWRPVPRMVDLDRVCSFYYPATVLNDNTVRISGQVIDIPPGPGNRGYAQAKVEVRQLLDGSWRVYLGDEVIATMASTAIAELRVQHRRKRPGAYGAFKKTIEKVAASLP